jgi:hypothetical protein
MVAQVDEQHAAMIANAMAPAGQANGLVDVTVAERAAGVGPVTMHETSKNNVGGPNRGPEAARKEAEGLPDAFGRGNRMQAGADRPKPDGNPGNVTEKRKPGAGYAWTGKPIV